MSTSELTGPPFMAVVVAEAMSGSVVAVHLTDDEREAHDLALRLTASGEVRRGRTISVAPVRLTKPWRSVSAAPGEVRS